MKRRKIRKGTFRYICCCPFLVSLPHLNLSIVTSLNILPISAMAFDFTGKVVIVTGSASGIGEDAVISFARAGALVVVNDLDESRAELAAQKCKNASPKGLDPLVVIADVTKEEDCIRLIATTIDTFKRLDILVNSAGVVAVSNLADEELMQKFDKIFRTNVRAIFQLTQLVAPHLERTRGVIVNISSIASVTGGSMYTPYHISKAALDTLTKCTSFQLAPSGVRVVGIR